MSRSERSKYNEENQVNNVLSEVQNLITIFSP